MRPRNWKHCVPRSPRESIEACVEVARSKHNRGVERLAIDHLGQNNHSVLYKWMESGRLPLSLVLPLEHACGVPLITRYLAAAHGKLLIDMPSGRTCSAWDMQELQTLLHTATGALLAFYDGTADSDATLDAIRNGLQGLAWHQGNVQQHAHPQLDLGADHDD